MKQAGKTTPALLAGGKQTNLLSDPVFTPHDDDSIERITVLGAQEPNPYLIPNMQQAYLALGYNPNMAVVTNLYVRFQPTVAQVAALDSIMDAQGLDLFDTPMDKDNIIFHNDQQGPVNSKGNRYWVAATVHNAVQEHNDYATQFGFSQMPAVMHIFVTDWAAYAGSSSTPLFRERRLFGFIPPTYFINNFMVFSGKHYVDGGLVAVANIASKIGVDMILDYVPTRDQFYSDEIKGTAYHEMSHASHYSKVGNAWYGILVTDELNEVQNHPGNDPLNPYGSSTSGDAPMIALAEAWGYHMGHFLADQRYGVHAYYESEDQGNYYTNPNGNPPLTAHPDIDVLENFIPTYIPDAFHWIPKGLMEDLMDNGEPPSTGVNDQVSGFTNAQIFNALQSDVTTVQQYRARLIQQNAGNQTTQITNLFASYNY